MHRRSLLLATTGCLALAAGCTSGDEEDPDETNADLLPEATVEIVDGAFDPLTVHIESGGTVTWENASEDAYTIDSHQSTTSSAIWDFSEGLEPGASTSHTFESDGQYDYTDHSLGEFTICGRVLVGSVESSGSLACE